MAANLENKKSETNKSENLCAVKKFTKRIALFLVVLVFTLSLGLSYKDAAPSLLNALNDKHELLKKANEPKIILLGGSNVSFGINSQLIHEHFKMPVVNMGLYAEIGLKYMLSDIRPYIKKSDIVVLLPEYQNFYSDSYYGSRGLIAILFDVYPTGLKYISTKQWLHLFPYFLNYAAVKVKRLPDYLTKKITGKKKKKHIGIYDRRSFNKFGDAYIHWTMGPRPIPPAGNLATGSVTLKEEVFKDISNFEKFLSEKGATLAIFPPCIHDKAYYKSEWIIKKIARRWPNRNYDPSKYIFKAELCFDSPYHLVKKGLDIRTKRLIEDLQTYLNSLK